MVRFLAIGGVGEGPGRGSARELGGAPWPVNWGWVAMDGTTGMVVGLLLWEGHASLGGDALAHPSWDARTLAVGAVVLLPAPVRVAPGDWARAFPSVPPDRSKSNPSPYTGGRGPFKVGHHDAMSVLAPRVDGLDSRQRHHVAFPAVAVQSGRGTALLPPAARAAAQALPCRTTASDEGRPLQAPSEV